MDAHLIASLTTSWAGTISCVDWVAKAMAESDNKLGGVETEAKTRRGDNCQPITSMRILDADRSKSRDIPDTTFLLDFFRKKLLV